MEINLERIQNLIISGDFDSASNKIDLLENDRDVSRTIKADLGILKYKILNRKGLYKQVLEEIPKLVEESRSHNQLNQLFEFLSIEFQSAIRVFDTERSDKIINELETICSALETDIISRKIPIRSNLIQIQAINSRYTSELDKALELYYRAIDLRSNVDLSYEDGEAWNHIGIIYDQKGELENSLKAYNKSLDIFRYFNDKISEIGITTNIGLLYWQQGKFDIALSVKKDGIDLARETKNLRSLTPLLINTGLIYIDLGFYDKAFKNFTESLTSAKSIGFQNGILVSHTNIGIVYDLKWQFDEALNHYQKSVVIADKIGDNIGLIRLYINIAKTYRKKELHAQAIEYLEKALELNKSVNNENLLSFTLFELVISNLERLQISKSADYLNQFAKLNQITSNESIKIQYQLAKGISLKSESGLLNRAKALTIFTEILEKQEISYEDALSAIVNSSEILVTEVGATKSEMDLQQIDNLISKMEKLSNNNPSIKVRIDILVLKSKISFMFEAIDEAITLLQESKKIAAENDLVYLEKMVDNEIVYIEDMVVRMTEVGGIASVKLKLDQKRNIDYIEFLKRNFRGLSI